MSDSDNAQPQIETLDNTQAEETETQKEVQETVLSVAKKLLGNLNNKTTKKQVRKLSSRAN